MKYLLTLLFILICTPLWAAENKQTYFCLSSSDQSQKLLVLADVDGVQVGYLDTDEYKLNDENGVLVGPSTAGSSFFKLASGKLDLMSSAGMWSGVCHQFTNENAQAQINASKSGEVVVSTEASDGSAVVSSSDSNTTMSGSNCIDNPKLCTVTELCSKASTGSNSGRKWRSHKVVKDHVKEARSRGLTCGVGSASSSSSSTDWLKTYQNDSDESSSSSLSNLSNSALCAKSIVLVSGTLRWSNVSFKRKFVTEAKSRGLTCDVGTKKSPSSSSSGNCSANPKACTQIELCKKATYINSSKIKWYENSNEQYVNEAKSRTAKYSSFSCGVGLSSSSANETFSYTLSNSALCAKATMTRNDFKKIWRWGNSVKPYVNLAKNRGLKCGVGEFDTSSSSYKHSDYRIKKAFNLYNAEGRKKIQTYLHKTNFYNSNIDGKWGSNTLQALKSFLNDLGTNEVESELKWIVSTTKITGSIKKSKPKVKSVTTTRTQTKKNDGGDLFGAILKGLAIFGAMEQQQSIQNNNSMRQTCFKQGEYTSGFNRICRYKCGLSDYSTTIGVTSLCPLTITN